MGEPTQSLRTSSKREILRGRYSRGFYNPIGQVSYGHKRQARFWHAINPNRRIAPFWREMGERTQPLRMSSKREILRGPYSGAYDNAIRTVSSGYKWPARFRHAKNPRSRIAPFWHELGESTQSLHMSSKREILRGRFFRAYYNAIRQVSSGN
jgi:hypothetical protein